MLPQNFYHDMLDGTHFFPFRVSKHPDEAPVFLVLIYHFPLNFDEAVPDMKNITIECNFCHGIFLGLNSETLLNALCLFREVLGILLIITQCFSLSTLFIRQKMQEKDGE